MRNSMQVHFHFHCVVILSGTDVDIGLVCACWRGSLFSTFRKWFAIMLGV